MTKIKSQLEQIAMGAKTVFVIHGRNESARSAMFHFLRSIGLQPLEWSHLIAATGKGSPYVGEVLEKGFSIAQAAVALMTPDDVAKLRKSLQRDKEPPHETELTAQPRQNVLFEAGMAMGRFPERTIIVELGGLRPMSDTTGRHVIRMDNLFANRQELANRLTTAGCDVDLQGTDWHNSGDFAAGVHSAHDLESEHGANFIEYLDGLSGTELYWLAKAVANRDQTINCYSGDSTPPSLVSKGLLERVPYQPPYAKAAIPHNIPMPAWRYLIENEGWLLEQTIRKNQDRPEWLRELEQWTQRLVSHPAEQDDIRYIFEQSRLLPAKLWQRYPFGWVLFNHSLSSSNFPLRADNLRCTAEWEETRLELDPEKNSFALILPELRWEREPQTFNVIENTSHPYTGTYDVGKPTNIQTRIWVEGEPQIYLDVLDDGQRSPVYVIGFKKPPAGSGPPSAE